MSTGAGVTVAVLDSGIDLQHEDLRARTVDGLDLIAGTRVPADMTGHGTHIAGIIAAHAGNGVGIQGAAPDARILPIRVLDAQNRGSTDVLARGIDAAVARGARVINLSLNAGPDAPSLFLPDSDLVKTIERAVAAGVVVVASAGNDSLPLCAQPIVQRRMLCVGAVDEDRRRAHFSNYGARVDIVAPGDRIMSTTINGKYGLMSGTSQAAPHVAAAAALLVARGLDAEATITRLLTTATDLGLPGPDFVYGAGLLDAQAAVGAASTASAPDARHPAKLRVRRLGLRDGRLDALIDLTSRARGEIGLRVTTGGRTHTLTKSIGSARPVRIDAPLPARMRRARTGIVQISYAGDAQVRPDQARLRAASGRANLRLTTASLIDGRLRVAGTISRRARGVVRIRYDYVGADGQPASLSFAARISAGRWRLDRQLQGPAASGGHLSIQFTGYLPRRLRGAQTTKAVP